MSLECTMQTKENVVDLCLPLRVRITRIYSGRGREYDDDNFTGGCKELRDAIAQLLGCKGDSEKRWVGVLNTGKRVVKRRRR